jgi:outer membrane receptor protein involved in Fe transport
VNGIKIASPDNKNRFVQLDIIPSDILSSIEISKSLTPNMEGDAIGGTVNMIVKDAPEITSFKATASIGYSQIFFNEKYIDFAKASIQPKSPIQRNPPGYVAQPGDFSRTNLDFKPMQAYPTVTLGFSYTQRFMNNKLGVVLANNFQNQYYGNISTRYSVTPVDLTSDSLRYLDVTNFKGYSQQANNGLVAHVDYVFNNKNRINIDNFFIYSYLAQTRLSEDTTLLGTGRVGPGTGQIFANNQSSTQVQYIENIKLSGKHFVLPNLSLDWTGMMSLAGRRLPDLANIETDYRIQAKYTRTATFFDQITRDWLHNEDRDYTGIVDLDYFRNVGRGNSLDFKAGGLYRSKTRSNNEDDYVLKPPTTNASGGFLSKPYWTDIYNAQWVVFNTAGTNVFNPNNYTAAEDVYAGYFMANYKTPKWELGGGLRYENTSTNWADRVRSPTQPSSGNQSYQDFLPSVFLKYLINNKQNLRASYFKSISRPNYYEITSSITNAIDYFITGNPFLEHAVADNFDIRYEIYPKGEQHLFVGVFYKYIQRPIELSLEEVKSGQLYLLPVNSPNAKNYGAEVSFTKYWGKFGVTGNYTYTHSAVSTSKMAHDKNGNQISVVETRPLQGQTDHVVNASLLFKDVKNGIFAQLAYQYQGTTLVQISPFYQSDYYQRPLNTLAFSGEKDLGKHFTIFVKLNNLLNTATVQYVQKTLVVSRDVYMASYSLGVRFVL